MKSSTYVLVGALVAIAILAIIKKHFFDGFDYDLPTQGNALQFGIEGYESGEQTEDDGEQAEDDAERTETVEGYEDAEDAETDDEHEDFVAGAAKPPPKKTAAQKAKEKAKVRAAASKSKKKPVKAIAKAAAALMAKKPAAKPGGPERFENTPRFAELKAKWDAYKAGGGPALTDAERTELLGLLDAPEHEAAEAESFEQFEEMPYQGHEYAMY